MSNELVAHQSSNHSVAMQIMFDDKMFERVKTIAGYMAKAEGFTPKHLVGKTEACYAVVTRSMTWGLDPFAVAGSTYQTPAGSVGYEGKLCHAILERSGKFDGRIKYEMIGDWSKIQGKFKETSVKKEGKNGSYTSKYNASDWKPEDEVGLGVRIIALIKGETAPEKFEFMLVQAQPRNSTLWALDPATQIKYLGIRRFANVIVPDIFMGIPFDKEYDPYELEDVTPEPKTRGKKERKQADEINDILSAQVGVPVELYEQEKEKMAEVKIDSDGVVIEPEDKLANARAAVAAAQQKDLLPIEKTTEPVVADAARKRMEEIKIMILSMHFPDKLREYVKKNESHIIMMPEELAQELQEAIDTQKAILGIAPGEDLLGG